jgi:FKBP-type peptidyl-prolyl cis-trans isomerase
VCFSACRKSAPPQLPSNKNVEIDSTEIRLTSMNELLIAREDKLLHLFVEKNTTGFQKDSLGFWYKIDTHSEGAKIDKNDYLIIDYQLFTLDNKKIKEEKTGVQLGKKNLTTGLENGLLLMRKGESATFIVPYYLAFGIKGNGAGVPPYTSVMYKITVSNH